MLTARMVGIGHRVFLQVHINTVFLVSSSDPITPQVNDKSNIQEVVSGRDAGCGSATSLVITITATIIGQHPPDHNMSDIYILSVRVGTAVVVLLCVSVSDVSRRSSIAS